MTSGTGITIDYLDEQIQEWRWTNSPPIDILPSFKIFDATWSVTGSGMKFVSAMATDPGTGVTTTTTNALNWSENGTLTPVRLQVRIDGNNRVIFDEAQAISLSGGLTGTRVDTVSGMPPTRSTSMLTAAVDALQLPAVQWNGPRPIDRLQEGKLEPAAVVGSPSPSLIGSRLGQKRATRNAFSYGGSQQLANPTPTGTQYTGSGLSVTSTADWSWRIFY
ncbi:MAG TPA: hypothetical protein VJ890_07950 [Vineibacter sp.]|nr:hypothetical protein [Vineibacter sp.]